MKKFKVTMVRTYTTDILIDAKSEKDAIKKFEEMQDNGSAYEQEMEQMNTDESIDIQEVKGKWYKFARKCDITGEGMNEGWVVGDGELYFKYKADVERYVEGEWNTTLEVAYDDDSIYWTSWEDEDEYEYESDSPYGKNATEI